jgi:hypothetical protein
MRSGLARIDARRAPAPTSARTLARAGPAPPARLQARLGNAGASAALAARSGGPRIEVGAAGDGLERQADAVADAVLAGRPPPPIGSAPRTSCVQRKCDACEDEALVKRKEIGAGGAPAGPAVQAAARAVAGGGRPLSRGERAYFEPRLGRDFSRVRLHEGPAAAIAAKGIGARAYTLGANIGFAAHAYAPGSRIGDRLLAHELAHTVQQEGGPGAPILRRQPANTFARPAGARPPGWALPVQGDDNEFDPGALYFPYARASRQAACPAGCHDAKSPSRFPDARAPRRTRVTKAGLIAWTRDYILESARARRGWVIARILRREDAQFAPMLDALFDQALKMVQSSHDFEGPAEARDGWAIELRLARDDLMAGLKQDFQPWAEGQLEAEVASILHSGKVPPDAQFVGDAEEVNRLENDPPKAEGDQVFKPGAEWFGRRVKAADRHGYIWFEVIGQEGIYFSMKAPDWRDMVWSNVATATAGLARVGRFIAAFAEALASPVTMALDTAAKVIDVVSLGGKALGVWEGATCFSSTCKQYTACLEQGRAPSGCKEDLIIVAVKEATVIAPIVEQGRDCLVRGDEEACGGLAAMAVGLGHGKIAGRRTAPLSLAEIEGAAIRARIGRGRPGDPTFGRPRQAAKPAAAKPAAAGETPTAKVAERTGGRRRETPAPRDYARGKSNIEGFARRIGASAKRLGREIKSLWDQVRDPNKVTAPDILPERFDAQMKTPENGGHTYRREKAQGGQFWCRWSTEACGLNPGGDFNAAVTETAKARAPGHAEPAVPVEAPPAPRRRNRSARSAEAALEKARRAEEAAARKAAKADRAAARDTESARVERQIDELHKVSIEARLERAEVLKSDLTGPEKKAELADIDAWSRKLDDERSRLQARLGTLETDPGKKLRSYSYSDEAGAQVADRSRGLDDYSKMGDRPPKPIKNPSVDHLNSIDEMIEWGILDLFESDQRRIVSLSDNLFMMEKSLNSSKGATRNLGQWKAGVRHYGERAIAAMQAKKAQVATTIKVEIAKSPKKSGAKGKVLALTP